MSEADAKTRFATEFRYLIRAAGSPTYRRISDLLSRNDPADRVSPTAISDWATGKSLPQRPRLLEAVLRVLLSRPTGRADLRPAGARCLAAYEKAVSARQETRPSPAAGPGRPVREWTAHALEVHRAAGGGLTEYVARDHDRMLGAAVRAAAAGQTRVVTLVGHSASGKTRAGWEAIQLLPLDWRLWHPRSVTALLAEVERVGPRTVVWLNDVHHHLSPYDEDNTEQVAAALRGLIDDHRHGPVLLVATAWPQHWRTLTDPPVPDGPDRFRHARELLAGSAIAVPRAFTADELRAVWATTTDERMRAAVERADAGQLTQHLAGVPALLDQYRHPRTPAVRALVQVAIDARRFGHPVGLSRAFLQHAATGYLIEAESREAMTAPDGRPRPWVAAVDEALADTDRSLYGVAGLLTRDRPTGGAETYRLADPIEEVGAEERAGLFPVPSFWDAALASADPDVLSALSRAAFMRGRWRRTLQLAEAWAGSGDPRPWPLLTLLRHRAGDQAAALVSAEQELERGSTAGVLLMVGELERLHQHPAAARLAFLAADRGFTEPLDRLVAVRSPASPGFRRLCELAAVCGSTAAWHALISFAVAEDDHEAGNRAMAAAAAAGSVSASASLGLVARDNGDLVGAERHLSAAVEAGGLGAVAGYLVPIRDQLGDADGADSAALAAAAAGDAGPAFDLIGRRLERGDGASLNTLRERAAAQDNNLILILLSQRWAAAGDVALAGAALDDAVDLRQVLPVERAAATLIDRGHPVDAAVITFAVADLLATKIADFVAYATGRPVERPTYGIVRDDALGRELLDHVEADAWISGVAARLDDEDQETAEKMAMKFAADGFRDPLRDLAARRCAAGDLDASAHLYQQAVDRGCVESLADLAAVTERRGRAAEADALCSRFAQAATGDLLLSAADRLDRGGDERIARTLFAIAEEQGDPFPDPLPPRLVLFGERAGHGVAAHHAALAVADQGDLSVLRQLAEYRSSAGDLPGAVQAWRDLADRGYLGALSQLREVLMAHGRPGAAEQLEKFGLDDDGSIPGP